MAISDKLTKLNNDLIAAYDAIYAKGAKIPQDRNTNNLASSIGNIPSSGLKPTLYAPTIVIDSKTDKLTITPNSENGSFNNLASYDIYNESGTKIGNTSDLECTVSDYVISGLQNTIRVKAVSDYFEDSDFSNEESWIRTNGLVIKNTSTTDDLNVLIGRLGVGTIAIYTLDNTGTTPVWSLWYRSSGTGASDPKTLKPNQSITIWNTGTVWSMSESQRSQFGFTGAGNAEVSGLLRALNNGLDSMASYGMHKAFLNCVNLVSVAKLEFPSSLFGSYNYSNMFEGCIGLINGPERLPSGELTPHCFDSMFIGCEAIETVPELSSGNLAEGCYTQMFQNCTSLVNAPELNATELQPYCYYHMFEECSSLFVAPTLPATTMAERCYEGMFKGCSGLTTAPELPAETLAVGCYKEMFASTGLTTYSYALPAGGTLPEDCYRQMFQNSTYLVTAPSTLGTIKKSIDKVGVSSLAMMFEGCTALKEASSFSCESGIGDSGALQMYSGCTSLVVGIDQHVKQKMLTHIPLASRLGTDAIAEMFLGCQIHGTVTWVDGTPNPEEMIWYYEQV